MKPVKIGYLGFALVLAACAALGSDEGRQAQATAARAGAELACDKHLARFREGKADGLSCEESKARAAKENPLCKLEFSCPSRDAGKALDLDGGAE